MRMLWRGLIALVVLSLGFWMHEAAGAVATDTKLLLARALIWASIAAGYGLWWARRPLLAALLHVAERVEQSRDSSLARRESGGWMEKSAIGLFAIFCTYLTILAFVAPDSFVHQLDEDGPFEMGTTICYAISAIACAALAVRVRGHRSLQLSLTFLALLFTVVGGEEISWGQRLFHFGTPTELKSLNVQGEFNLHDIYSISLFTYPALATTATLLFIAPLLWCFNAAARRIFDGLELPVAPPVCAALYGIMVCAYFAVGFRLGTPTPLPITWSKYPPHFDDEMMEFLISVLFAVFSLSNWRFIVPGKGRADPVMSGSSLPAEA